MSEPEPEPDYHLDACPVVAWIRHRGTGEPEAVPIVFSCPCPEETP